MEGNKSDKPQSPSPAPVAHTDTPEPTEMIPLTVVAIDSIEHHYIEVMKELAMEPHLGLFKDEYEKIHRLLRKSNEGEKRLLQKIKELQHDLACHGNKVEAALKLSQDDEEIIVTLRKEIEKAWTLADSAHAHEKESREHIQKLRHQVAELDTLVDKTTRGTMGQEAYLRDLIKSKKDLENDHLVAMSKVSELRDERNEARRGLQRMQANCEAARLQLENNLEAYQKLLRAHTDIVRERDGIEQQVRESRETTNRHIRETEERRLASEQLAIDETRLQYMAKDEREAVAGLSRQLDEQQRRFKSEADRLAAVEAQNAEAKLEIPKLKVSLRERHAEVERQAAALRKLRRVAEGQQAEMRKHLLTRDSLAVQTEKIHEEIEEQLTLLEQEEAKLREAEVRFKQAMPEKTHLISESARVENERVGLEGQRVVEEGKRRNLEQELEQLLRENEMLRKNIFRLEHGQTKMLDDGQRVALQYHQTVEQTRKYRESARVLQAQLTENEKRLKTQQDLLDRVMGDRARTESQLKENEVEWAALRQRHQRNEEEIARLKFQLIAKETALCQMHMVHKQLQRDISNAETRASHLRDDCANANSRRDALVAEAQQLNHLIAECDAERSKYQAKFAALVNERNVLATQLIRRNEELRLLYSKIRLQQCALEKGASDYNRRVLAVGAACGELDELRLRCRLALVRLRYAARLRRRKQTVERELFTERQRSRALIDELNRPVHVHRWRQLEGNAPAVLDGIYKVQTLEREIIRRGDALLEKTRLVDEQAAAYEAVRHKLAVLPGPELAEDLALYTENLERRTEQINGMNVELRGVEQTAEVLTEDVRQLSMELADVKRRYYDAKHKNDLLQRERAAFRATWGGASAVAGMALAAATARKTRDPSPQSSQQSFQQHQQQLGMHRPMSDIPPRQRLWHTRARRRREQMEEEARLVEALSSGVPAPMYPLQYNTQQRQFVGGGFAITR